MRNWFTIVFCGGLLLTLCGCNPPVISTKKTRQLCIASDFLRPEDAHYFSKFKQKEGIKVVIVSMSADSIVSHYQQFKYNAKFDAVLMKSTYALDVLSKAGVLHALPESHQWKEAGFVGTDMDWITIGIDPYVVAGISSNTAIQYGDLTFGKKWNKELTQDDMVAFQSSILTVFGRKNLHKSLNWLEQLEKQATHKDDSIEVASYYLTRLSHLKESKLEFVYPNQVQKKGAFYDGIGMGLVRHGSNYTAGLSLIAYCMNLVYNQQLCEKMNVLPIQNPQGLSAFAYQNTYPILFRCTPQKAVSRFRDVKRIRSRIE